MNNSQDYRGLLAESLSAYRSIHTDEAELVDVFLRFLNTVEDCFERTSPSGHFTASAWIVNPERTHVLLTHHRKLNKWIQLGGHADGESNLMKVATKEMEEESGLTHFMPLTQNIFDISLHAIPPHKNDVEHMHYDVRYIFTGEMLSPIVSDESHDVCWIPFSDLHLFTTDPDMIRMMKKSFEF